MTLIAGKKGEDKKNKKIKKIDWKSVIYRYTRLSLVAKPLLELQAIIFSVFG